MNRECPSGEDGEGEVGGGGGSSPEQNTTHEGNQTKNENPSQSTKAQSYQTHKRRIWILKNGVFELVSQELYVVGRRVGGTMRGVPMDAEIILQPATAWSPVGRPSGTIAAAPIRADTANLDGEQDLF